MVKREAHCLKLMIHCLDLVFYLLKNISIAQNLWQYVGNMDGKNMTLISLSAQSKKWPKALSSRNYQTSDAMYCIPGAKRWRRWGGSQESGCCVYQGHKRSPKFQWYQTEGKDLPPVGKSSFPKSFLLDAIVPFAYWLWWIIIMSLNGTTVLKTCIYRRLIYPSYTLQGRGLDWWCVNPYIRINNFFVSSDGK